uniref:Uncharacterized protein n=1 Tax=Nymphaea colorata TaxID=210225 RepID=A0A5K1EZR9_9MAGN|nr:unnamed protein product [Nymphaea colorata]
MNHDIDHVGRPTYITINREIIVISGTLNRRVNPEARKIGILAALHVIQWSQRKRPRKVNFYHGQGKDRGDKSPSGAPQASRK